MTGQQDAGHAGQAARGLDAGSRRLLAGFAFRAAVLVGCASLPWWLGLRSLGETGGGLALAFSLGGFVAMLMAAAHHDRIGRGSLNGWDEALAFNGLSLLLHLVLRLCGAMQH